MFRYTFVFLSLSFFAATAQSAWDEKFYNPQPLADDVILPLPCEGSMAFRIVKTNTHKPP